MDKASSDKHAGHYKRDEFRTPARGRPSLRRMPGLAAAASAFGLLLILAACSARDDRSDERRPGGFYVGGSGGLTRP